MKPKADKLRSERQFQVREMVLLNVQPYAQHSVVSRPCQKLAFKFFGPYKVLEHIGSVAYHLELPDSAQVHLVFHVSSSSCLLLTILQCFLLFLLALILANMKWNLSKSWKDAW
jgi:hypothetical protein